MFTPSRIRALNGSHVVFNTCCKSCFESHGHEGGLEDVVGKEVPPEVEEVVDDVDLALLGLAGAERLLGLAVARVDEDDEDEADDGGDERGHQEEAHRPQGDHAVHLGVQTRGPCSGREIVDTVLTSPRQVNLGGRAIIIESGKPHFNFYLRREKVHLASTWYFSSTHLSSDVNRFYMESGNLRSHSYPF